MIEVNKINGLVGGQGFLSGLVRLVREALVKGRTRARVRACPPCPVTVQVTDFACNDTDKDLVRPCPPHDATAIGGTDRGREKPPPKGGAFPPPGPRPDKSGVSGSADRHPNPFGSSPASPSIRGGEANVFSRDKPARKPKPTDAASTGVTQLSGEDISHG